MNTICFGLLVMMCLPPANTPVVDSFCQSYQRVILAPGDGAIQATIGVKRRLAANEVLYRRKCPK